MAMSMRGILCVFVYVGQRGQSGISSEGVVPVLKKALNFLVAMVL